MKLEFVTTLIKAFMLFIAVFIAPAVKSWFEMHSEDMRIKNLQKWALIAATAAEKIKDKDPDGAIRLHYAKEFMYGVRSRMGLNFSDEEIDKVIESTVRDYNEVWNMRKEIKNRKASA